VAQKNYIGDSAVKACSSIRNTLFHLFLLLNIEHISAVETALQIVDIFSFFERIAAA
jgi:hypothetical protein